MLRSNRRDLEEAGVDVEHHAAGSGMEALQALAVLGTVEKTDRGGQEALHCRTNLSPWFYFLHHSLSQLLSTFHSKG